MHFQWRWIDLNALYDPNKLQISKDRLYCVPLENEMTAALLLTQPTERAIVSIYLCDTSPFVQMLKMFGLARNSSRIRAFQELSINGGLSLLR
jgi:hypothetical protein